MGTKTKGVMAAQSHSARRNNALLTTESLFSSFATIVRKITVMTVPPQGVQVVVTSYTSLSANFYGKQSKRLILTYNPVGGYASLISDERDVQKLYCSEYHCCEGDNCNKAHCSDCYNGITSQKTLQERTKYSHISLVVEAVIIPLSTQSLRFQQCIDLV